MIVAFVLVLVLAAMVVVFLVLENRDLDKRLRGEQMRADAASDDAQRARSRARIAADQRSLAVTGYQDLLAEVRDLASQLEASHGELLARPAAPDRRRPARQVAEGWAVTWRAFLLTTVAAAAVAVLVTMQVRTRDITLTTSGVTTQEEGAYLGWARTGRPSCGPPTTRFFYGSVSACASRSTGSRPLRSRRSRSAGSPPGSSARSPTPPLGTCAPPSAAR